MNPLPVRKVYIHIQHQFVTRFNVNYANIKIVSLTNIYSLRNHLVLFFFFLDAPHLLYWTGCSRHGYTTRLSRLTAPFLRRLLFFEDEILSSSLYGGGGGGGKSSRRPGYPEGGLTGRGGGPRGALPRSERSLSLSRRSRLRARCCSPILFLSIASRRKLSS